MGIQVAPEVLFVCVGNRVRSIFAELYLTDMFGKKGIDIRISSAGFFPQGLKDLLNRNHIPSPRPFYSRPMSEVTMTALREKGIHVPEGWRSKELSPAMVKNANLLITALGMQKDELVSRYEDERNKILSIRELLETEDYLFFEDFTKVPMDDSFWHYCEEDPGYVAEVIRTWEQTLIKAIPNIIKQF